MTKILFACSADNEGFPTCQGDGQTCGPPGTCVALMHPNMPQVYEAWRRGEKTALDLVNLVNKGQEMTNDERLRARVLLRGYGVEPDEIKNPDSES